MILFLLPILGLFLMVVPVSLLLLRRRSKNTIPTQSFPHYRIENRLVYYFDSPAQKTPIDGADAKTFQALTAGYPVQELHSLYGRDFENVYYKGKKIESADPVHFQVLGSDIGRDDKHVFKAYQLISADAKNFKCLDDQLYKDSHRVFFGDRVISEDPGHFKFIGKWRKTCFYKDRSRVFVNGKSYIVSDIETFHHVDNGFFADSKCSYQFNQEGFHATVAFSKPRHQFSNDLFRMAYVPDKMLSI